MCIKQVLLSPLAQPTNIMLSSVIPNFNYCKLLFGKLSTAICLYLLESYLILRLKNCHQEVRLKTELSFLLY